MILNQENVDAATIDFEFEQLVSGTLAGDLGTMGCSGCHRCAAAE